jgi:Fic family protein
MNLNYKKLIQFDLLNDAEAKIKQNHEKFFDFLSTFHNIAAADKFIKDCPSFPDSNKSIIRDELVSAIGSTLAIEGIVIKGEDIKKTIDKQNPGRHPHQKQQEIHTLNSQNVYNYIQNTVRENKGEFVYKDEHIIKIHKLFTANIDYVGNQPGKYRNMSAFFGDNPRRKSLCENYEDIYMAMGNFINWLNQKNEGLLTGNIIAKAIMAHYYLAEIHPFGDGNGRTARAVEAMVLYANKINPYCFWSLANFWNMRRNDYISRLGEIRDTCDCLEFLIWGAKGYLEEVERIKWRVLKKVKQLMLQDYTQYLYGSKNEQPPEKKINERIVGVLFLLTHSDKILLDKLRSSPGYKSLYHHISGMTQNRDFSKMKSLKLIRISETDGKAFIEPNYELLENLEYSI